jgi:hypothetical protein
VGNNRWPTLTPSGLYYQDADGGYHQDYGEPCNVNQEGQLSTTSGGSTTVTETAPPVTYDGSDPSDFTFFTDAFGSGGGGGRPNRACVASALQSVIARGEVPGRCQGTREVREPDRDHKSPNKSRRSDRTSECPRSG